MHYPNSVNHQPNIDKNCLYAEDSYEAKYKLLVNIRESVGLKHCNDSKAFIEYSNDMDDTYEIIDECSPNKKRKILILCDVIIADMLQNTSTLKNFSQLKQNHLLEIKN